MKLRMRVEQDRLNSYIGKKGQVEERILTLMDKDKHAGQIVPGTMDSVGANELLPALAGGPSITAQSVVALAILLVKASFPVDTLMYLSLWLISWRLAVMRILVGAIRAISWLRF